MRLSIRTALVPALIVAGCAGARAQSIEDAPQSPYFVVQSQDGSTDGLPLKSTSAEVDIAGVIANVKVVQVYRNDGRLPLEAIYVFPGSTRSAVHALTMTVGDRVIHAQIKEREAARKDYELAKQEGRSASLLEQQRPNVFQMNVANILPGDEIKVELEYTELLEPTDGSYRFVYPTVVGPRYAGVPGTASTTGEKWVASPYTGEGRVPDTTIALTVRLTAGMPIRKMTCSSHKTAIAYQGAETATVQLDPTEAHGGNRDFILNYQLSGGAVQSGLLLHRGVKENFFLVMAQPPKQVAPEEIPAREYIFIMDVSGSQMGFPLEISKELMKEMIQGLRPEDRFNVMIFEGSTALWSEQGSVGATPSNLKEAIAFVQRQGGGGGTELGRAMKRALTLPRSPGISRSFVISTDGFISADASLFDIIREHLGDANLFTFGIGTSVNRHLIEGMAHVGQGEAFVLTNPAQAHAEAERFRAYVSTPALTNVLLTTSGFEAYDVEPMTLPDVLAQRPVVAYGKWRGEPKGSLTVSGVSGRGSWSQTFEADKVPVDEKNPALRQLWARKRIQLLSDYAQFGMTDERKREITELGLGYSLLTPFTSFVAVDPLVRNHGPAPIPVQQPLPLPQGVTNMALPATRGMSQVTFLAPGVTGGSAFGTATSSSACVEVCGASSDLGGDVSLALSAEEADPKSAVAAKTSEEAPLRLGALVADQPTVPIGRVGQQLDSKLRSLARAGLLKDMPATFRLTLQVDASGAVVSVTYDRPCGKAGKLVEFQLLGWRFETWTVPGTTKLSQPVQVLP